MTIYQSGAPIQGWNDLPPIPLAKKASVPTNNSSTSLNSQGSTASAGSRRRRVASHDLNTFTGSTSQSRVSSQPGTPSSPMIPPPVLSKAYSPTPPLPPKALRPLPPGTALSSASITPTSDPTFDILPTLERLVALPTSLSAKEFTFYKTRLLSEATVKTINTQSALVGTFVESLLEGLATEAYTKEEASKALMLFMVDHVNVCGTWGVSLKKIIEGV
ncbi:hypothetical protein BABINDRAFT_8388 [Babjeviella inositovora NRRL Y-12698]|uniref:Uncharacterized protein n=1 Tax=Babjeviella inositovora NRRL Y-12698 TaxID=984486 RepID=A0A1E3QR77_9ASCO|nr:uncharacterized protein BABINDRAFT_8388 [Babjeviella inositovora NRRL Y-12698]ODQ79457.1 hypothetical protein BABINDRAFT_8388 [Babjeviella inositovora NRRL Y-12698]